MAGTLASYDGTPIFGSAVRIITPVNPPAQQVNEFFGANGQEALFGGTRGRISECEGVHYAQDVDSLVAAQVLFESYNDGIARTLIDTKGREYDYAVFDSFVPVDRIFNTGAGYGQKYRATFKHLA